MAYLTYSGANTGIAELRRHEAAVRPDRGAGATFNAGQAGRSAQSGCLACHVIGDNGNNGPGPPLTHIGSSCRRRDRVDAAQPDRADAVVQEPRAESPQKFNNLVGFLSELQ